MKLVYTPPALSGITVPLEILAAGLPYEIVHGSLKGFGGVEADHFKSQSPGQNGSTYFYSRYTNRKMEFGIRILTDTIDEMMEAKRTLSRYFTSAYGEGVLRIYTDTQNTQYYDINVVPNGNTEMFSHESGMNDNYCVATIKLTAHGPYFYSEEHRVNFAEYEGGFTLPFKYTFNLGRPGRMSLINDGDVPTPARIVVDGPFTNLTITNHRTDEFIRITKVANLGEKIIIDTDPEHSYVTFVDGQGVESNIFNDVTVDSTLFLLQNGQNDVTYSDDAFISEGSAITFFWRNKYLGVF